MQRISDDHGGNRATGTPGGTASGDYIVSQLRGLGLAPTVEEFTTSASITGRNIVVDLNAGSGADSVLIGAHYDSVPNGPGIVDNGSGVANLLSLAEKVTTEHSHLSQTIRLAFWDAEETGVEGSVAYVKALTESERARISGYVNIDMSAGKNAKVHVFDGDRSSAGQSPDEENLTLAPGSADLEARLRSSFPDGTPFLEGYEQATRSDGLPFNKVGIAVTGISTVVDETPLTTIISCYHQSCDDIDNVDREMLQLTNAALQRFAVTLAT